ncbi:MULTISPECIES: glycosyltransferase family 25 protein [unclassified Rhizobium]|uniref:glycosyltransferase family 25 protein n=1 Tax=unclassified Rhizobium TaxID=2613769 RepID=UPI0016195FC1|nr:MULTISPECIES: glycosyltransferase family 25 protein [unclassified Rhizobium]MBB3320271.1 glycosyl transferase family 25 [Rhizobium sp. BK181]MBB3543489.1 glycosyl transferase family 25 [Rhizobium sp. BK399]MCS3742718.1 glycosyl transferase family 25 [Rhizobium sp. BK661]MCS4096027.1 glycosyl transferase family 25 [Rhizobium sp. BK176]
MLELTTATGQRRLQRSIGAYVINMDGSSDRWAEVSSQATLAGIQIDRVPGVDGRSIPVVERSGFNEKKFLRRNGRQMLPGEYGCYRAHMRALQAFLSSDYENAIIMEDDVELRQDFTQRAAAILQAVPSAEVVKLLNHRSKWCRTVAVSEYGDEIGRCLHGPQGSAACYLVTREGARKLLRSANDIEFPYDMTLERGWKTGVSIYTVRRNIVELSERSTVSQIANRAEYRAVKLRGVRKIGTHLLRMLEYARRIRYALS